MRKPYWLALLCLMAASAWGQNLGSNGINNGGASGGSGTVTSIAPNADGCLSTSPNPIIATGTIDVASGKLPQTCLSPSTLTAGTSVALTAPRQYYICTSTCTVTPPVPVAGYEFCVMNDDNVATVVTLAALGSSAMYENTARTAYGTAGTGTFSSGGAVGDKVCIIGRDATHYLTPSYNGVWTAS